jgi:class 3 adenylate cyclase
MSGLLGEPGRQQYDVIGATVHLAARLCSIANEGEIVATPKLVRAAAVTRARAQATRAVNLRGFPAPIECVSF